MEQYYSLNDLVAKAHVVVTATCSEVRATVDPERPNIVGSAASFVDVRTIRVNSPGTAPQGSQMILHYLGGSSQGIHLRACDMPRFSVGERYLLFLLNDGTRYISPVIGGEQGRFRLIRDTDSGIEHVVDAWDYGIVGLVGKEMERTRNPIRGVNRGYGLEQSDSREEGHQLVNYAPHAQKVMAIDEFIAMMEAIPYEVSILAVVEDAMVDMPRIPHDTSLVAFDMAQWTHERGSLGACLHQDVYIWFEQNDDVPGYGASWSGIEDYSKSIWDVHMNIFSDTPNPTDGFDAGNGESEIAGWLTNSEINSYYGYSWGTALAKIIYWATSFDSGGEIVEADIMMKDGIPWTTDWNTAFATNAINYRNAIVHEMGHAWGYQAGTCYDETYDYGQPSVMHAYYFNQIWEDGKEIHSKDAQVMRGLYDDQTTIKDVDDLGIESYKAVSGIGLVNGYVNHTSVASGETMRVYNVTVENNSNVSQSGVRVRFYLSTNRTLGGSDHLVGNYSLGSMNAVTRIVNSYLLDTDGVPPGTYYIGMKVSRGGTNYNSDDRPANDVTWSTYSVQVTPSAVGLEELPTAPPLSLFPNPCSELLYVEVPDEMQDGVASVFDPTGRILIEQRYSGNGTSPLVLEVAGLTAGAYVVMFRANSGFRRMARMVRQ